MLDAKSYYRKIAAMLRRAEQASEDAKKQILRLSEEIEADLEGLKKSETLINTLRDKKLNHSKEVADGVLSALIDDQIEARHTIMAKKGKKNTAVKSRKGLIAGVKAAESILDKLEIGV